MDTLEPYDRCGPHRCWPSRVGWGFFGCAVLYCFYLHFCFYVERRDLWPTWDAHTRQQQAETLHQLKVAVTVMRDELNSTKDDLNVSLTTVNEQITQARELTAQARQAARVLMQYQCRE